MFSRRTEVKWARSPPTNSVCRVDRDLIHHVFQELWRLAPQKREKELGDLRFNVDCDLLFIWRVCKCYFYIFHCRLGAFHKGRPRLLAENWPPLPLCPRFYFFVLYKKYGWPPSPWPLDVQMEAPLYREALEHVWWLVVYPYLKAFVDPLCAVGSTLIIIIFTRKSLLVYYTDHWKLCSFRFSTAPLGPKKIENHLINSANSIVNQLWNC